MGATTFVVIKQGIRDNLRWVSADVTFSNSYSTGGDSVAAGQLGLKQVKDIAISGGALADSEVSVPFRPNAHGLQLLLAGSLSAPTLKVLKGTTSEVASTTDLSAIPAVRVEFRGI